MILFAESVSILHELRFDRLVLGIPYFDYRSSPTNSNRGVVHIKPSLPAKASLETMDAAAASGNRDEIPWLSGGQLRRAWQNGRGSPDNIKSVIPFGPGTGIR